MSPAAAPLVLDLYDEENEKIATYTRVIVPWKMTKRGIRLYKKLGDKSPEQFEEEDIDELTNYVLALFDKQDLTIEMLDNYADTADMFNLIKSIVYRAKGVMDPTLPPKPT